MKGCIGWWDRKCQKYQWLVIFWSKGVWSSVFMLLFPLLIVFVASDFFLYVLQKGVCNREMLLLFYGFVGVLFIRQVFYFWICVVCWMWIMMWRLPRCNKKNWRRSKLLYESYNFGDVKHIFSYLLNTIVFSNVSCWWDENSWHNLVFTSKVFQFFFHYMKD